MNRIKISPLAKSDLAKSILVEQKSKTFPKPFGEDAAAPVADLLDYTLFIPQHYEANYSYPLIVWLHAEGLNHRQLLKMMPQLSTRNYAAISIGNEESNWDQNPRSIEQTTERIQVAIDHAHLRLNIDRNRVFIAGMGLGGTMAMRMAFFNPHWFAGVVSLNGSVPDSHCPLSNWTHCRSLPVFWAHARKSKCFSEQELCKQLRLLHIGGFSVTLRQYPCGDHMGGRVLNDTNTWIMETLSQLDDVDSIVQ